MRMKGVAILLALFTAFAVLVMGVTYIGLSIRESRATIGHRELNLALDFANAGIEFAINYMGDASHWQGASDFNTSIPSSWRGISLTDVATTPSQLCIGMTSPQDLAGALPGGNPTGFRGSWDPIKVTRVYTPEMFNRGQPPQWKIEVTAKIFDAAGGVVSTRTVEAMVTDVFGGSIIQNIRAWDSPNFRVPNQTDGTHDCVFVTDGYKYDGRLRIDGGASPLTGYDSSGSLKIKLRDGNNSNDPLFKGALSTKKGGVTTSETPSSDVKGIVYNNPYGGITDQQLLNNMFGNRQKPFETGVASLNIGQTLWGRDTSGNPSSASKLSEGGSWDGSNFTPRKGTFETIAETDAKWCIKIGDGCGGSANEIRPDPMIKYNEPDIPTVRITLSVEDSGGAKKEKIKVEKMRRKWGTDPSAIPSDFGTLEVYDSYSFYPEDESNFKGLIYVQGANVQVSGQLKGQLSIVSDENERHKYIGSSSGPGDNIYNAALKSANIWDSSKGEWVFGGATPNTDLVDKGYKLDYTPSGYSKNLKQMFEDQTGRFVVRYPKPNDTSLDGTKKNVLREGNLTVIDDTTYYGEGTNNALGLLAKNYVYLSDITFDPETEDEDKKTLEVHGLIGSADHSLQFDWFNQISKNSFQHPGTVPTSAPSGSGLDSIWSSLTDYQKIYYWWKYNYNQKYTTDVTDSDSAVKLNGCIVSKYGDVESQVLAGSTTKYRGYATQINKYDRNMQFNPVPFFSTGLYDRSQASSTIMWTVFAYHDFGAMGQKL